jgi:protein-tyrosine phosphatase
MLWHGARWGVGRYRPWRAVDWAGARRIVFVCKGNICRSAYAEAALAGRTALPVASAGLDAETGTPADPAATATAAGRDVDLGRHRSLHVSQLALAPGDVLVAFEPAQADALQRLTRRAGTGQVTLLGLWSSHPWLVYIHDPYGLPKRYFDVCFDRIDDGLQGIARRIAARG